MDVYGPEVVAAWGDRVDTGALHEARKKLHGERFLFNAVTGQNEYGKVPPQVGTGSACCSCSVIQLQWGWLIVVVVVALCRLCHSLGPSSKARRLVVSCLSCSGGGRRAWLTFVGSMHERRR